MSKGLLDVLLDRVFDAEWQGRRGEKLTERELKLVQLFGRSGKTLRNVYVPKDNGETSEIDVLFITQKGIFVIESKNYSGWVFGDEDSTYWTVMLPNRQKNRFYNPVKQNKTHVKWLRNYIGGGVPLFSLVVFSERCELKKISAPSPDVFIIKRDRTYAAVRNIWEDSPDVLSEAQVSEIYEKLKILTKEKEIVYYSDGTSQRVMPENEDTRASRIVPQNEVGIGDCVEVLLVEDHEIHYLAIDSNDVNALPRAAQACIGMKIGQEFTVNGYTYRVKYIKKHFYEI